MAALALQALSSLFCCPHPGTSKYVHHSFPSRLPCGWLLLFTLWLSLLGTFTSHNYMG